MVLLAVLIAIVAALSLCVGAYAIPVADVLATLFGQGQGLDEVIVMRIRLPRLVLGILVGAVFGLSGALFQSLLDNPLASPDIMGISGGASAAAVYALIVLGLGGAMVSLAAFLGGLAAALAIYLLAWRDGITGYRFILIGIGVAFMALAAVEFLLTRSDVRDAQTAMVWLVGSLGSAQWDEIAVLGLALGLLAPLAGLLAPALRALQLGDDAARGLGEHAERVRLGLVAVAVALAAAGTAAAGPVAFVAFVSAPIARRLVATGGLALLPCALLGVLVVTAADFVALHLLPGDVQLPVGVVTGAIGAPYLLWLLAVTGRAGARR
jgi:iron-siderophore transport system permease protein